MPDTETLSLAFVAEGNAETRDCWSGCAQGFVRALRNRGAHVETFDAEPTGLDRWALGARTWRPAQDRWRNMFRFGDAGFALRSRLASRALRRVGRRFDAVIQAGATFCVDAAAVKGASRIVYADANIAFARAGAPYSGVSILPEGVVQSIVRREQRVYDLADRIWTWSDALRESFSTAFGQPIGKLLTIYAGANTVPAAPGPDRPAAPRVLFVGRDARRKGLDLLIAAFRGVRAAVPGAELHVVGSSVSGPEVPGVVSHGYISAATPEGQARVSKLYSSAMVFCMPSRYEPFGAVFIEAMLAGLPCIGSDAWAMPEIIERGKTGWLVPDGDVDALRAVLVEALMDPGKCALMGAAGRARALERFLWDRVARRALDDLRLLRRRKDLHSMGEQG